MGAEKRDAVFPNGFRIDALSLASLLLQGPSGGTDGRSNAGEMRLCVVPWGVSDRRPSNLDGILLI
jgi:hypothetical protein